MLSRWFWENRVFPIIKHAQPKRILIVHPAFRTQKFLQNPWIFSQLSYADFYEHGGYTVAFSDKIGAGKIEFSDWPKIEIENEWDKPNI